MDSENTGFNVNQTINGDNYGSLNAAHGDIHSINNNLNSKSVESINDLIDQIKELINGKDINEVTSEDKEFAIDDLDTIKEQVKSNTVKPVKLKKAYEGLKTFIGKIPSALSVATLIATKSNELYQQIKPLFGM